MSVSAPSIVCETVLLLVTPSGEVPVSSRLRFRASNPWAVEVEFLVDQDEWVVWTFARELLDDGRTRPVGTGDVTLWPGSGGEADQLFLRTSSPHGVATFALPLDEVGEFLSDSYSTVAAGSESDEVDIDAELQALLGG